MDITPREFNAECRRYGTDKGDPGHFFGNLYAPIINDLNCLPAVKVLEIGVATGGSLKLWHGILNSPTITAVDIDPLCAEITIPECAILIGDQADLDFLEKLHDNDGPYNLVVDDGSHLSDHQVNTFSMLWPGVPDGGWYVIEDLQFHSEDMESAARLICTMALELAGLPVGSQPCTITFCGDAVALHKGPTFEPTHLVTPPELDIPPKAA